MGWFEKFINLLVEDMERMLTDGKKIDLHLPITDGFDYRKAGIKILGFLLVLGVVARFTNYFMADLSLWNDEAALAIDIGSRDFWGLFAPLDRQVAPIGFCVLTKLAVALLGENEFAFRLLPFISGTAAIGLTFFFVHKAAGAFPALLCAAQLAVAKEPLYYANNFKPYAVDLAVAMAILLLAWEKKDEAATHFRLALIGVSGILAVWLSFPAIFILGGIGALWAMEMVRRPKKSGMLIRAAIVAAWLISFWIHFQFLQSKSDAKYILDFWADYFLPMVPKHPEDWYFYLKLPEVFRNPLWTSHPYISVVLYLWGCAILFVQKRYRLLVILVTPLLLNLFASGLNKYPFGDRMLQYGVMHLFIPISIFLVFLMYRQNGWKWLRAVAIMLIAANLAEPAINTAKDIFTPRKREQVKQVVQYLSEHPKGKLPYYIFGSSSITFTYYMDRLQVKPNGITIGPDVGETRKESINSQIAALRGDIWLLFGHGKQHKGFDYEVLYIGAARDRGKLLEQFADTGAAAYLFRFQ